MENGEASEPEDGEILDDNEGELAKSEEEEGEGAYGHYSRPNRQKRTSRNSRPSKGYSQSRMERFVKNTEAYKHLVQRRGNARKTGKTPRHPTKPYNGGHSRGPPHEHPYYGSHRPNDRNRGSFTPANHLGGSTSQGTINLRRYSFRSIRKPMARDFSEILGNDGCGPCSPSRLEIRRKRFQEDNGSDHIRVTRTPIRPNGVNNKVLPGSSKVLKTVDTVRTEACSSGTSLSMPNGPAVIPLASNPTGNPDVEPVSDYEESGSVIPRGEIASGKKSPLIITLSSTDTSDDDGENSHREIHRQRIIADDNRVISIVAPVEHAGVSKVEQGHLESELQERTQDEVVESLVENVDASTSNVDLAAAYSPGDIEDNPMDDEKRNGMEVEVVEVVEGDDSNSKADKDDDKSIEELELRNQLLADLVEKTGMQDSANTNAETNVQNLEGSQTENNETNAGAEMVDADVPDEEETALREVLISQMAKRNQGTGNTRIRTSVAKSSGVYPAGDSAGNLQISPGPSSTTQEQRGGNANISPPSTARPPIVGPSSQSHTSTPNSRRGASNARKGRSNRNRNRHKSDGNKYPLKSCQISPNLLFDAQQHRVIRIANEPIRHPAPHVINRPANLKNLPDNDLRNKLLRNRRNEQQQQAQDTSIISLFPEFGVADTDMRRVDITPRAQDQISDMTIRRTVNFDPSPSASPTTNSSAITYMAPINVEIPPNDAPSPMGSSCLMRLQNEAAHPQFQHHSPFMQSTPPTCSVPISLSAYIIPSPVSCEHRQALLRSPVNFNPPQASPQGHGYILQQCGQVRPEVSCSPFGYPGPSVVPTPVYPSPQQAQLLPTTTIHGNQAGLIMSVPGFHNQISFDVDQRFRPQVGVPMYFVGNHMNDNRPQIVTHDATRSHSLSVESNTLLQHGSPGSRVVGLQPFHSSGSPTMNTFVTISESQMNISHDGETMNTGRMYQGHTTQQPEFDSQIGQASTHYPVVTTTAIRYVSESEFIDLYAKSKVTSGANLRNLTEIRTTSSSSLSVARSTANVAVSSSGRNHPIVSIKVQQQGSPDKGEGSSPKDTKSTSPDVGVPTPTKTPSGQTTTSTDANLAAPRSNQIVKSTTTPDADVVASRSDQIAKSTTTPDANVAAPRSNHTVKSTTTPETNVAAPRSDKIVKSNTIPDVNVAAPRSDQIVKSTTTPDADVAASRSDKIVKSNTIPDVNVAAPRSDQIVKSNTIPDVNVAAPRSDQIVKSTTTPDADVAASRSDEIVKSTTIPDVNVAAPRSDEIVKSTTMPDVNVAAPRSDQIVKSTTIPDANVTAPRSDEIVKSTTIPDANVAAPRSDEIVKSTTIPDANVAAPRSDEIVKGSTIPDADVAISRSDEIVKGSTIPDADVAISRSDHIVKTTTISDENVAAPRSKHVAKSTTIPDANVVAPRRDRIFKSTNTPDAKVAAPRRDNIVKRTANPDANVAGARADHIVKINTTPDANVIDSNKECTIKNTNNSGSSTVSAVPQMSPKSVAYAANIPKPKPKVKPVTPVVIPVTEGDTTEDEDDDKVESQDGSRKRRKDSVSRSTTSSDPANPMFHTYLDKFLKNCREKVDKLEKEKSQEVKKGQETSSRGIIATDLSHKQGEKRTDTPNMVLPEKLENAVLGVGVPKTSNAGDGTKKLTALHPGPGTKLKNSPNKASNNMQVALKEGNAAKGTLENEANKMQVLSKKREGSPSIQLPQNKRRAVSGDPSGTQVMQLSGSIIPITAASPVIHTTKAISSSSSVSSNVQDTSVNSKAVIESLTERVTETRNQIHLSLKEKELIQSRQNCYNEFKDILRDLQHHTRISNLNTRLDQDIVELEKKLAALKKKKEAAQQKGSDINKSIREKSKNALTHKKSCLSLATDVKKLGDKIIGDKKYKVPDILVENINELMRSMRNMDSKQPETLQRERGVPFKQLIFDEGTFSSSIVNLTAPVPSTSVATTSQLQSQKSAQQKRNALSSASVESAINTNRILSENLLMILGKEGKTDQLDSEMSEASQNKEELTEESQSEEEMSEASKNEKELSVSSPNTMDSDDEVEPQFISSSKSLHSDDVNKGLKNSKLFDKFQNHASGPSHAHLSSFFV